jgi:hypothetical protein
MHLVIAICPSLIAINWPNTVFTACQMIISIIGIPDTCVYQEALYLSYVL